MLWAFLIIILLIIFVGLPYHIDKTFYTIQTPKVTAPIRIGVIADLHTNHVEKSFEKLLQLLKETPCDLICMPGDIFEQPSKDPNEWANVKRLANQVPTFFVTGNHEECQSIFQEIIPCIQQTGIHILTNETMDITTKGQQLEIGGVEDYSYVNDVPVQTLQSMWTSNNYRILLAHRPHRKHLYQTIPADLILSGHAHGGHWRIPFTKQGLFAPQQNWFPKDTEGMQTLSNGAQFVISRGFVKSTYGIPRLYNNPEMVFIDLIPQKEK